MSKDGSNESDQCILEEIEALKAIFFSELDVIYSSTGRPLELSTTLFPSTADDTDQHYVCVTLVMKFPLSYPEQPPMFELKNPRGLGEDFLANVLKRCNEKCHSFSGSPVIYEIIELVRESLTDSNRPTGHCTICLFNFHDEDVFTYTQCYHHFHSHCLSRYCESLQKQWAEEEKQEIRHNPQAANHKDKKFKQFTCPVCRNEINVSLETLKLAPPPHESDSLKEEFRKDPKLAAWRKQMEQEYQKQKSKGGIIDQLAEDNRFLVVTETTNSSNAAADATPSPALEEERVVEASANQQNNSRDQSKYGRGGNRNVRKPEFHCQKMRSTSVQSVPSSANSNANAQLRGSRSVPQNMDESQQHHNPRPTNQQNRRPRNTQPTTKSVANGQPSRPPPGFQPR